MKLSHVTLSGLDDGIDYEDIERFAEEYPRTEFGILLNTIRGGADKRYPSLEWIQGLKDRRVGKLAGHFCGMTSRHLIDGIVPKFDRFSGYPIEIFDRIQINFAGKEYSSDNREFSKILKETGKLFIFQMDGVNDWRLDDVRQRGVKAIPFYDRSFGRGILPDSYPEGIAGLMCGYGGGLNPENIETELGKIAAAVGKLRSCWIDLETGLRDGDDNFDFSRASAVLEVAAQYFPAEELSPV